ncbi:MAG: MATE family efflux transporter [Clostridiales bacterium]|nr:MATE family efflux transporter [Clostridiales bacterium]
MDQTFMKEKKVMPLVLSMSYPMAISMAVNALYNIVDSFFVAKMSSSAMTALSLLFPVQNFVHAAAVGFGIGINAVVAFYMGAGKTDEADRAASSGTVLSILHGLVLMVVCIAVMPWFMSMFSSDAQTIEYGIAYTGVLFLFAPMDCTAMALEKIFQSTGRMKSTMFCLATGCIINIILDPLMIFGIGPFPEMGIKGAALATGIGQTLPVLIYFMMYRLDPLPVKFRLKYWKPEVYMMKKLYSVGNAAALNIALPSVQVSVLNGILASYSAGYVFVLGVYYKLQTFLYLSANGVVQGIRPLVGYNYGAGEHSRVKEIVRTSTVLVAAIMVMGTVVCLFMAEQLMGIYTHDIQIIALGAPALRIISAGFIISSISVVLSGALEGLSKGNASLVISLIRYIVFILPVAFLLSRVFGAVGVWHAFWITEIVAAVISYFVYVRATRNGRDDREISGT